MKAIVCEMCGGKDLIKLDGMYVCQTCGTQYSTDEAKKLLVEVDDSERPNTYNSEKLNNYYTLARRARENDNNEDAHKYYDLIRQEAPNDWEANFFSVYFKALGCKIAEIASAANSIANCIPSTFSLIKEYVQEEDKRVEAVEDVCSSAFSIADLLEKAADNHYNGISDSIKGKFIGEWINNVAATGRVKRAVCNGLCDDFADNDTIMQNGIPYMKQLVQAGMPAELEEKYMSAIHRYEPDYDISEFKKKIEENTKTVVESVNKNSSGGGCYVATAVYGSYDCPQVWTLRRYRDYTLAETWYGRAFIRTYYAISPTLVKWFGRTSWFKGMWKPALDGMIKRLNSEGVADTPYDDIVW